MKRYVGTEELQAQPMTRGAYNIYRGWVIPENEDPSDEGYLIHRNNGHTTWMPKDVFEKTYSEVTYEVDNLQELKHDLLTSKYTKVYHGNINFNAPHLFRVFLVDANSDDNNLVGEVHFQEGPIKEVGVNGVCNEDLIAMVICRLDHFQKSEYVCRENAMAITNLEQAMMWLRKRTMGREQRGVEGTSVK